ncbi:hypothetical protein HYALB_00006861 [Hymenoscyphus albidus]|uniref:SGS-domain-containing protein n=1 Tax=Hymenoscyphus albidus TaxID=595503 RepID=A0A9N9LCM2_9HELO|nr:hypothetical protein HYALB_00006861 [Hymenoscyphus albidus]
MSSHAARGQEALGKSDYPAAIEHLTLALKESPSPLWLIQRSTAYQRTNQHELALEDANNAVIGAVSRARRELIATAEFRRGVALYSLGRLGDARLCFNWARKYNEKEKGLTMWLGKVAKEYDAKGGGGAECNKTTVVEVPDKKKEVKKVEKKVEEVKPVTTTAATKTVTATPKEKIRQEWYQSTNSVTIEVFAKGVPKDKAEILIEAGSLEITFPVETSNSTYTYHASPLFSPIDPSKSSFRITPHKIEIILHKSLPGTKWSSLEGTTPIPYSTTTSTIPSAILNPPKVEKAPVYPTSSKSGPKDWEKLGADEEGEEDGDGVDDFFKKLYKDADPDTRRAMMKSYQESNGTSLSTDWKDVGARTFETTPPEGMEAKKFES